MLNLARTPVMVAPAGIPATVMFETDAGYDTGTGGMVGPSGITTFTVPELNVFENDWEEELFSLAAGSPKHIVTELGVIVGAGGV
jgi:hypothetical protein